jgi:imidazole glycerol-phosphate synthase subunit HisF
MIRTRVIPCLLLKNAGLVKTVGFKDPRYVGDPINAIRIFNEKEVHELLFLDISATIEKKEINYEIISNIASECFMPLGYGGGIKTIDDIQRILNTGVEKVVINSSAVENPEFIRNASDMFGSQSIVISIDAKKNIFGSYDVFIFGGRTKTKFNPVQLSKEMEQMGAGEIIINSIDRDGSQTGYDIPLIKSISESVSIPVVACGGAGKIEDFGAAVSQGGASAIAAGSMFVYYGKHRAVLINFPTDDELKKVLV